ncbi:MAG: hypothetical protein ACK4NC_05765 [Candidatus Gracilibacteria bacterium]
MADNILPPVPEETSKEHLSSLMDFVTEHAENSLSQNLLEGLPTRSELSEQEIKDKEAERKGREEYFKLRNKWSIYLVIALYAMILFQFVITFFIGFGIIDFTAYPTFISLVIGENFLQIVGMCLIVVKFLFPDGEKK